VPGELAEQTKARLMEYGFAHERLAAWIVLESGTRILNGDEPVDAFVGPLEVLKVIQPDRSRCNNCLRGLRAQKGTIDSQSSF
jgi:hypothetical protein